MWLEDRETLEGLWFRYLLPELPPTTTTLFCLFCAMFVLKPASFATEKNWTTLLLRDIVVQGAEMGLRRYSIHLDLGYQRNNRTALCGVRAAPPVLIYKPLGLVGESRSHLVSIISPESVRLTIDGLTSIAMELSCFGAWYESGFRVVKSVFERRHLCLPSSAALS